MLYQLLDLSLRWVNRNTAALTRRLAANRSNLELLRRSDLFDAEFYLETYQDVAAANVDPAKHYLMHGAEERRQPSKQFDALAYLDNYPDVRHCGINPLIHYLRYGRAEGRLAWPRPVISTDTATSPSYQPVERRSDAQPLLEAVNDAAERRKKRLAEDREVIVESGLFDVDYYLTKYPDVANANIDALDHYVEWGGTEGRRPHPLFDPAWYTMQYPDLLGSGVHPLVHYWTIGRLEGASAGASQRMLDIVTNVIKEAGDLEPTIMLDPALADPSLLTVNCGAIRWPALHAWRSLFDSLDRAYEHIVFVPWMVRGGADLAAANAARAAIEVKGIDSTLVVLTDYERTDAVGWLPKGAHLRVLSHFGKTMTRADRSMVVEQLILSVRPKSVLNVNSAACWDAFVRKGAALKQATNLYAFLFCRDYTPDGRAAGYADTHFRDALPHLKSVYFDNSRFMKELADDYGVPPPLRGRLTTLHQPVSGNARASHDGGPKARNRVIWAGRFCKQKNVELLLAIVALAPEFSFDIYGYGDEDFMEMMDEAEGKHPNLRLKGPFSSTAELPLASYNAFLYTSLWDGLPLTLADVASIGIPIVASAVGGIPDLVNPTTGWLVEDYRSPQPYISALQQIRDNPDLARIRAREMMLFVNAEHSWDQFVNSLRGPASFIG
ncbi:glycosyltransferase [Paraburkholderia strydomiana]|uniref:glycosyltransferase family 4 protein n=1 Tax=Paraburkholderia strydomiana TaxID=1245417 RepID=UPI0038BB2988